MPASGNMPGPKPGNAPPLNPYSGGSVATTSDHGSPQLTTQQQMDIFQPPPVPGKPGPNGSGTTVDTASLDTVARNIGSLTSYVQDAMSALEGINIQPGTFADARQLTTQIMGPAGQTPSNTAPTGQVPIFGLVLKGINNVITSTVDALTTMSQKYQTAEDLNSASATDVQNDLNQAGTLVGSIITANGGTPATSTGTGNGTGNGNGNGSS